VGVGRSFGDDMVPGERDKPSVYLVSSLVTGNGNGPGAARLVNMSQLPMFSAISVLAKGPVGLVLPVWVDVGVFCCCMGQVKWVVPRQSRCWAMALLFFAVATPCTRWLPSPWHGPFWVFFRFKQSERLQPSVLYRHAGPWYFYALVPGAAVCPGRFFYCPWPSPARLLRLGLVAPAARASQLARSAWSCFLVVLFVLLRRRH